MAEAVASLLADAAARGAASERCRAYMARRYSEERVLADYLDCFERVLGRNDDDADIALAAEGAGHA